MENALTRLFIFLPRLEHEGSSNIMVRSNAHLTIRVESEIESQYRRDRFAELVSFDREYLDSKSGCERES